MAPVLRFEAWQSSVTVDFWQAMANHKLDNLRLDPRPLRVQGVFSPCTHPQVSKPLQLNYDSLSQELNGVPFSGDRNRCPAPGLLYNTNTLEEFKALDLEALLREEASKVWEDICSGRAEEDCKLLNRFLVISYADLKEWKFKYRFCIPALVFKTPVKESPVQRASDYLPAEKHADIRSAVAAWRGAPETCSLPFFLLEISDGSTRCRPLHEFKKCQPETSKVVLCFYDPCHRLTNPGWPLRNLLMVAAARWKLRQATVLCWRELQGRMDLNHSIVMDLELPEAEVGDNVIPAAFGWEPQSRVADLASMMDPSRLAISAADLNLKLMKWRHLPSLKHDTLSATRCLLLGAGTLGCQVARSLLAWGVRDITFVDFGKVGLSNPLRQSLYRLEDCGRPKAEAAADALRKICPDVRSSGEELSILMAGHPVGENQLETASRHYNKLKDLIEGHDVVFLLTDTRESRWLPTLLCSAASSKKVVVNTALGFDSYVVMRHGDAPFGSSQDPRLGCYFCNDVVAPADSTTNRTLDQQCTVTRPGLAPIAGALAVELAVAILHHPLGISAPADQVADLNSGTEQPLGILPHQIRGFLSHCSQLVVTGLAFSGCTACSPKVVAEVRQQGFEFVVQALNSPRYLENLTGLTELMEGTQHLSLDDWDVEQPDDVPEMTD